MARGQTVLLLFGLLLSVARWPRGLLAATDRDTAFETVSVRAQGSVVALDKSHSVVSTNGLAVDAPRPGT